MAQSDGSVVIDIEGNAEKFKSALGKLGNVAGTAMKGVSIAVGAASAGVGALAKQSLDAYSSYEQLTGGVETLFKSSSGTVMDYADNAFKTAGMSANEYMETVTSFSASLLQGLGGDTEEAAKVANVAITDMSDNANKMGTAMGSIQDAYQGFAKQNYTMLDNLKLGYGGTQAEMARLINDSGVLGDTMEVTAKTVNNVSFDKIIQAIHVVQERMGITGTTAEEAASTIEGSVNMTKAAWKNLVTGIADENADLEVLLGNLIESASTAAGNIIPRITQILSGMGEAIRDISPVLVSSISELISSALPAMLGAGAELITSLLNGIIYSLPQLAAAVPQIISSIVTPLSTSLTAILEVGGQLIQMIAQGIVEYAPKLVEKAAELVSSFAQAISDNLPAMLTTGADMVSQIISSITENLGLLIEAGMQFVASLVLGILQALPELASNAAKIVGQLIQSISDSLPGIISTGAQIVDNLIFGLADAIPKLAQTGVSILSQIVQGVSTGTQQLISKAAEVISAFAEGISSYIPILFDLGLRAITTLIEGIADSVGELADAAPDIIESLVEGISDALPKIAEAAVKIIGRLAKSISDNLPKIIEAGVKLITNLITGLVNAIPKLAESVPKIISCIVDTLAKNGPEILAAGVNLIGQIIIGLISAIPQLIAAVPQLVEAIIKAFTSVDWIAVGKQIIDGIVQGIKSAIKSAGDAIKSAANSLVGSAKKALKIKSPSRVFADEVGEWIPPGISEGVDKAMPELDDDMRNKLQSMVDDANLSVMAEVSGFSNKLAVSADPLKGYTAEPSTITNDNGIVINLTYNGTSEPEDVRKISRQIGAETARELRRRGIPAT